MPPAPLNSIIGYFYSSSSSQHTSSQAPLISIDQRIRSISANTLHFIYLKHWKFQPVTARIRMLLLTSLTFISVYIISPTVSYYLQSKEERRRMFTSKRKDKFTTGLINTRNDCFANSSVQAFASLPGLNLYLNDILQRHQDVQRLGLEEIPKLPLHMALAVIVDQLQEQITTTKAMSVWPFLQVIESIFNSKISTNQNDAHELIQLILETLENENIKLRS
jgi:ubiquitin carboxyl-terminal hydrolase 16